MAHKPITKAEARKALQWAGKLLGLDAWTVELIISDTPPAEFREAADTANSTLGMVSRSPSYKTATIWISPAKCKADGSSPISCLMHEMMHIACAEAELSPDNGTLERVEFLWNRLGDALADLYKAKKR